MRLKLRPGLDAVVVRRFAKFAQIVINAVSKRVRQLTQGRPALVEKKPGMREADIALQEIIEGKIKIVHEEIIETAVL